MLLLRQRARKLDLVDIERAGDIGLGAKVGAFIEGGANFLTQIGLPIKLGIAIMAVLRSIGSFRPRAEKKNHWLEVH